MTASPTPRTFERIEVLEVEDTLPITWRVEAYDADGGMDINIFSGGDAKERAIDYAGWRYHHVYKEPDPKCWHYHELGDADDRRSEDQQGYDGKGPRGFI